MGDETIPCYTLSDLKWTQDVLILPERSRSVPLRYLACELDSQVDQEPMDDSFEQVCGIYDVRTGRTIIEIVFPYDESSMFSELLGIILKSKLGDG